MEPIDIDGNGVKLRFELSQTHGVVMTIYHSGGIPNSAYCLGHTADDFNEEIRTLKNDGSLVLAFTMGKRIRSSLLLIDDGKPDRICVHNLFIDGDVDRSLFDEAVSKCKEAVMFHPGSLGTS